MLSVSIVHGPGDGDVARELGSYLERNCAVDLEYSVVRGDLLAVAGRALASDVFILLLSPESAPRRFERAEWEPLFIGGREAQGTEIAYVRLAECPFPKVLLRGNVFAPVPDVLACARELKRWILELRPPANRGHFVRPAERAAVPAEALEEAWRAFADAPALGVSGDVAVAREFADRAQGDFESVFWVDCRSCTLAEAAGELGRQLGLRLPGDLRSNMEALRGLCGGRRCLLVLEGADEELAGGFAGFGRTSVMVVRPTGEAQPVDLVSALSNRAALARWVNRPSEVPGSGEIRRTLIWWIDRDWKAATEFAAAAVACYRFQERFAEAFELVERMLFEAVERRDPTAARDFGRERRWILEAWGVLAGPSRPGPVGEVAPEQLGLFC